MNYHDIALSFSAIGTICIAIPFAKVVDTPSYVSEPAAIVVQADNAKLSMIETLHIAVDSGVPLLTPDLLDRWVILQRSLLALPDSVRSTVPSQVIRYKEVAPELGNDSATFKNWSRLAESNQLVTSAFANAKISMSDYASLAEQMIIARAIIKSRNLAADSIRISRPPPSKDVLKALKPVERAIAVILPRWFELSKSSQPQLPKQLPYAVEESDIIGDAAPALLVEEWLNADNTLVNKIGSMPFNDGKLYLIGFTATWCTACRSMYTPFAHLSDEYTKRGVRVILVSPKFPSIPELKTYVEKHKITIPVAVQGEGLMSGNADLFKVKSLPVALLIDGKGVIRRRWLKATPDTARYRRALSEAIDSLLAHPN